ncbi:E22 family MetX-like putative esterase [Pseudoalteromonas piscicida]|uniref:Probable acyltransferase n=1 Tax=Pseudoalteromonas piscicida TaxID=43662 RepID=A0A2A5JVB4_PSEO7|nr:homoserine O-acetyltransferase [Pseudoalteromonas piscicida]PCK33423.1 homoserine acetyltransferase [Pseudoalteromonas piscicida]
MKCISHSILGVIAAASLLASSVFAATPENTMLVKKQVFETDNFATFNGETIKKVRVGWESYGTLNEDKSNVILITHYFSGNSHAAGKYAPDDAQAGYWDKIIGPGKAIDTNKFFVISSDTLVNAGVHMPNVITTGPATINPDTNKPYGLDFPVVTVRDFVNVQKALLESLGIDKLYAVIGPSMGSIQAIEWAAAYPDKVERMVSVIGMAQADAWTTAALEQWSLPIKADPNWAQGNYYDAKAPLVGIRNSLMLITQQAMHPKIFNQLNSQYSPLEEAPMHDITADFSAVNWLKEAATSRAKMVDANHILYLVRACQLFVAGFDGKLENGLKKITAKTLFLPASNDVLLMPYMAKLPHQLLKKMGKNSQYDEIPGSWGHLDGVYGVQAKADVLAEFLAQ